MSATPEPGLLAAFMSHAAVIAWIKDSEGRYVFASPAMQRQMSPSGRPLAGLSDSDLLPPPVVAALRAKDLHVLETGEIHESVDDAPEINGVRRSWFSVRFPVAGPHGALVGGMSLEITRYRQAERDKRVAENEFQQTLDAIADMIFVKSAESRMVWANRAFREFYGMTNEQMRGMRDAPFSEPDHTQQYVKDDQQVFESGLPLDIPAEPATRHDGKLVHLHTVKSPIFDSNGKVVKLVAVCRDISDSRRLELELRQSQKLEAIGRLASGIAHEINTPIQFVGNQNTFLREAIEGLTRLCAAYGAFVDQVAASGTGDAQALKQVRAAEAEADLEYVNEALPRAFDAISEGVARVARLVRAMKEFGHPDRSERSPADLNRALNNTLTIVASELRDVAEVEVDLPEQPLVPCALGEINQVFMNLIINAAHAISDAARGRGLIRIRSRSCDDHVLVSIGDNGGGIPEAIRHKIFEPFFTTKEVGRGTGQGLAIARSVIEKHGGSLTFETELGVGTTFHVRLPIRPNEMGESPGPGM
jgi:PAS domain S-box-containing protein